MSSWDIESMGQSGCGSIRVRDLEQAWLQHSTGREKGQEPQLHCSSQELGPEPASSFFSNSFKGDQYFLKSSVSSEG